MRLVKKQRINQLLGEELPEKITSTQVVKGMVLNGLGLVSSPLYLFCKFFGGKQYIVFSKRDGKLFLHQTRVIARNTCLNLRLK